MIGKYLFQSYMRLLDKLLVYLRQNIRAGRSIYFCIRYSGLPFIFREVFQKNKVTILTFHDIEPEIAEITVGYLIRHYNIISLDEFFDLYRGKRKFPPKSLIITFDDGHKGNYDLLPVFKKHGVPVTIFLCSGIINTNRHFWVKEARAEEVYLPLSVEQLKKTPNGDRLQILKKIGFEQEREYINPHALSKKQICEMLPYVSFQSHTLYHPCLTECSDSEAHNEILTSKRILEDEYGLTVNAIAYPNGDYSDRDIRLCMSAGYEFGLTMDPGFNTCNTDPFKLKRIYIYEKSPDMNEIITHVSGVTDYIGRLLFYR